MTMKPETILLIPLALYVAGGAALVLVSAGLHEYDQLVENRNTVTFNIQARTGDGYDVNVQARARAYVNSGSDFASDAEKSYARMKSEAELRSALGLVVLQNVANDACQFNNNDLSGTFLQEVNGASFSHLENAGSLNGVTKIAVPANEQEKLISRCAPVATLR